ncbi:hypothetical protein KJZ99_03740 [bacterium]|nr:hypothetical protein [bacterium]
MKIKADLLGLMKSNLKEGKNVRTFAPAKDGFSGFLQMHRVGEQSPKEAPQRSQLQSKPPVPKPAVSTLTRHSSQQSEAQDKLKSTSTAADPPSRVPEQKQSERKKSGDYAEKVTANVTHVLPAIGASGVFTITDASSMLPSVKGINKLDVPSLGATQAAILSRKSPSLDLSNVSLEENSLSTKSETDAKSKQSGTSNSIGSKPEPLAGPPRSIAERPAKTVSVVSRGTSEPRSTGKSDFNGGQSVPAAQTSSARRQSEAHAVTIPEYVVEAKSLSSARLPLQEARAVTIPEHVVEAKRQVSGLHRPPAVHVSRENPNLSNTFVATNIARTETNAPRSVESVIRATRNDLARGSEPVPVSRGNLKETLNKENRERQHATRVTQHILPSKVSPEIPAPRLTGQGANLQQRTSKMGQERTAEVRIQHVKNHLEAQSATPAAKSSTLEAMSYQTSVVAKPRRFTSDVSAGSLTMEAPAQEGARKQDTESVSAFSRSAEGVSEFTSPEAIQMHPNHPKQTAHIRSQDPVFAPRQPVLPDISLLLRSDVRSDLKATDPSLVSQNSTAWQSRSRASANVDSNPTVLSLDKSELPTKGVSSLSSHGYFPGSEHESTHGEQSNAMPSGGSSFPTNGLNGVSAKAATWGRLANETLQAALQQALEQSRRRVVEPDELHLVVPFEEFGTLDIDVLRENDLYSIRIAADPTVAAVMEEQRGQIAIWLRDQGYPVQQIEISERGSKQYHQHTHSNRAPQDGDPSQNGSVRHPGDPERRLDHTNQAASDRPAFFGRRVWTA